MPEIKWTPERIRKGIDLFLAENGRMPTSWDFDLSPNLPSARQIQRSFGGLGALRKKLGYDEIDFTKGDLRTTIAKAAGQRGITAEEYLEPLLMHHFGEPFVHVQKRYFQGTKHRYDFFIYAKGQSFAVDVFTTERPQYISVNIRHKIERYRTISSNLTVYFVLVGKQFTVEDAEKARVAATALAHYPNFLFVHESEFLELIYAIPPLDKPENFVSTDNFLPNVQK